MKAASESRDFRSMNGELATIDAFVLPDDPPEEFSLSFDHRSLVALRDPSELQTRLFQLGTELNRRGYTVIFEHNQMEQRHTMRAKRNT